MTNRLIVACCLSFTLFAMPALSQSADDVRGTWSGDWRSESGARDRVTVEFQWDGEELTGKMLNPGQVELSHVRFDAESRLLVAEAVDSETSTTYKLELRLDDATRMNGTLGAGTDTGDVHLVKWTYVPRIRY